MDHHNFATKWQDTWNRHDLDAILSHYHPDIVFRSRKAIPIMGTGVIKGRDQLATYWAQALAQQPDLHFRITHVFSGHDMMTITYSNHHNVLAAETLYFDAQDLVTQAAACHQITWTAPAPPDLPA